ncbi:MAG: isochorismate synthase [Lamprobacter sp.]|uniref:isochorismate synthase n=1 Tax=Lamprobacter sp. TaxID=3100796 RepID=UPI002B258F3F|nr:isochorismate synthase [Lamprobacter sp.]MEA3641133.1 isochorismate synthase [Lamprobacter sp.]
MLAPLQVLDQLKAALTEAVSALPLAPEQGVVSLLLALPRVPSSLPQLGGPQFQFRHVQRDEMRAGFGCAAEWRAEGPDRLRRLAAVGRALSAHWDRADPDETGLDAFALFGFAASSEPSPMIEDHLPNALLWVPEIGVRACQGEAALVLSASRPTTAERLILRWGEALERLVPALYRPIEGPRMAASLQPEFAEPDAAGWAELVAAALQDIETGVLQKVVLSRRLDVAGTRCFDVDRLLGALSCLFPSCQVVQLRRNGSSFVAATPERLLSQHGREIEVDAIAGTADRDADSKIDAALGQALRVSDKNLREHQFVIDAIREALASCSTEMDAPAEPQLMQLSNAQHLWSPIRARADAGIDLFELAERLHPTPATNGQPRHTARGWLQDIEPFERGWYTGAAGTLDPDLSGELWVLLRCARVCGHRAELYAGAGIVKGSDPATEWDETEAKLRAILSALQYA